MTEQSAKYLPLGDLAAIDPPQPAGVVLAEGQRNEYTIHRFAPSFGRLRLISPASRVSSPARGFTAGDILVRPRPLAVAVASFAGLAAPGLTVVRPRSGAVSAPWLAHALRWSLGRQPSQVSQENLSGLLIPMAASPVVLRLLEEAKELVERRQEADSLRRVAAVQLTAELTGDRQTGRGQTSLRLGDVVVIELGGVPQGVSDLMLGVAPLVLSAHLQDGDIGTSTFRSFAKSQGRRIFPAGTLLLGAVAPSVGRTGRLQMAAAVDDGIVALVLNSAYPTELLWNWLRRIPHRLRALVADTGLPGLTIEQILDLEVPPVPAAKWVQMLREIEGARSASEGQAFMLRRIYAKLLDDAMTGRLAAHLKAHAPAPMPKPQPVDKEEQSARQALTIRQVWQSLSPVQQQVATASLAFDKPFSFRQLEAKLGQVDRERLNHTLRVLVLLGVLIKDGGTERWRRPHPELDREVQV
ncbi:MAG TPA: hypothetical protein VD902_08945 [Symbiobacteriaceae bacterium]|nr:hypothetical protein [Symbiobacteriaceae bacterium]